MDTETLIQLETDVLISLVRSSELRSMGIPEMHETLQANSIEVIHCPIKDKWIPSSMKVLVSVVNQICDRLREDKKIVVHCNGGKGRTGLVVAATLVRLGMEPNQAIAMIRHARPGMLRNPMQILYLKAYARRIRGGC
eukprot:TRINITY_DN9073_c0_g1_i2.p1 TRINITY_DN9073_c0_g1~~TRINITY_DN9073_c0_g1_i2.p1  ORF type:complete len:138 (+),score=1.43 TRINITY_DN9073_c0_g1_i2:247-660(+)